jgi:hypothetical protein
LMSVNDGEVADDKDHEVNVGFVWLSFLLD